MNQFGSRGRQQDEGPVEILSDRDFGGAVVQFELLRNVSRNLASKQAIRKLSLKPGKYPNIGTDYS